MTVLSPSDDVLVAYLLGTLPDAEAERLDEQSVVDDAIATRLEAIENDLVDDYVRGTLTTERRARFEAHYLAGPRGQQKVRFAGALRAKTGAPHVPRVEQPFVATRWLLAAAAIFLVLAGSALMFRQWRDLAVSPPEVAGQPSTPALPPSTVARGTPPSDTSAGSSAVAAFRLPVARRGGAEPPVIAVSAGDIDVVLHLELDRDVFPEYAVVVKEAGRGRVLHDATRLRSAALDGRRIVSVLVPVSVLPSDGIVELTGLAQRKQPEPISTHPFRLLMR